MNDEKLHASADASESAAPGTALRLFEQANGMNDFPVLKAFQEYIEAEQARARKRTLGLSVFFVVLLVVVVVTFSVIMAAVINRDQLRLSEIATRNQALSDKLLDIALRARTPAAQPVVNVQQPPTAAPADGGAQALKPVLDRLAALAETLKGASDAKPAPSAAVPPPLPAAATAELDAVRRQQDALAREREAVAAARRRLKEEQEQLRRDRVEQHRRRLYPDYYAREAEKTAEPPKAPAPPPAKAAPAPAPAAVPPPPKAAPAPVAAPPPQPPKKAAPRAAATAVDLKTAKPIRYFDDAEEGATAAQPQKKAPTPPSAAPSPRAAETPPPPAAPPRPKTEELKVGTTDGEAIPWLVELPEDAGR